MNTLSRLMCSLTLLCGQASAATISWGTAPATINVNDSFLLNITGSGFTSNVDGGGVNVSFDSSIFNVMSVSIDEVTWDFGGAGISTGSIDNNVGTVEGIMVNTFGSVSGSFNVATIQFLAVGSGTSVLSLTEYALNPWASSGSPINPIMVNSSLDVGITSVPVPAAIWFFGSGLLGLVGITGVKRVA